MNILEEICLNKKNHIEIKRAELSLEELKNKSNSFKKSRDFIYSIKKNDDISLIAEVKKASPSKGIIRKNFNPAEIGKIYEQEGATCISVLTDEPYFQGHDSFLQQVKSHTSIPLLRKDFIIDEYQIWESKYLGADCILLIMAALSDKQAEKFYKLATSLGMDTLFEVHNEEELKRCLKLSPQMIGVNSRNLKTLEVSIETTKSLANKIPDNIVKVAESGIKTFNDIATLSKLGYKAFLVGESLTKQEDIPLAVKKILGKTIDTKHELN